MRVLTAAMFVLALLLPALPLGQYCWVHPTVIAWRVRVFGPDSVPRWFGNSRERADVVERFIRGTASESAMREAVVEMIRATCLLAGNRYRPTGVQEPFFITSKSDNQDTHDTGKLLASPNIDPKRFDAILSALADAYTAVPIQMTCEVESAIMTSDWPVQPVATLTEDQRRRFARLFLEIHAQPERAWSDRWGLFIEDCFGRGLVTQKEFAAYLSRMLHCTLTLSADDGAKAGDFAYFQAAVSFKGGLHLPVMLRVQPGNAATAESLVGTGTSQISGTRFLGNGIRGRMVLPRDAGAFQVAFVVTAEFGPQLVDEYKSGHSGGEEPDPDWWARMPTAIASRTVTQTLTLAPPGIETPEFALHGMTPDDVIKQIKSWRVDRAMIGGRQHVRATIYFRDLITDLSMDAAITQGDVTLPLGWSCTDRFCDDGLRYQAFADSIDAEKPLLLTLSANTQRVGRPEWNRKWWDGAIALKVDKATVPRKGDPIDPALTSP